MRDLKLVVKRCRKCGETKPVSQFHRDRSTRDGLASQCKPCRIEGVNASQAKRRELIGEEAWRLERLERVQKHRASGKEDSRNRIAYRQAEYALREAHPAEFTALLRQARYELGLDPDGHRREA